MFNIARRGGSGAGASTSRVEQASFPGVVAGAQAKYTRLCCSVGIFATKNLFSDGQPLILGGDDPVTCDVLAAALAEGGFAARRLGE